MKIKLQPGAFAPTRANPTDAGLDLSNYIDTLIQPGSVELVDTGVSFEISTRPSSPLGVPMVGLVIQRSGLTKLGVSLANSVGVIDADYRGTIKVALRNHTREDVYIKAGTRIAQILFVPIYVHRLELYEGTDENWVNTNRGTGGFGSTGN